ncbi:MAG TPA: twin-arginine translocation signal domain-containing protein, partial [Reyranella sp.]|nr:twin-arginine translocation signal domain-containing protein [Reyranella sp.]
MCDRIGCTHFPKLQDMDFSGRAVASRRSFLKKAAAVTTITMGMGGGMIGAAHAAGAIKGTHGTGFCNLNIFLAHSRQYAKAAGVELAFINTPTFAEQVTFLGMGQVDIGLMPYT